MHMKLGSLCFALSLVTGLGCGGDDEPVNNTDGGSSDKPATASDAARGDTAPAAVKYTAIMIVDRDTDNVMCSATNGPGADIDAVELQMGTTTVGVGKLMSASFAMGGTTTMTCMDAQCRGADCKYSDAMYLQRITGPRDGRSFPDATPDEGYFSLNGGRVALEIGDATGNGTAMEIKSGMKVKVWEVDKSYIPSRAPMSCVCAPERFEVYLLTSRTTSVGAVKLGGATFDPANSAMCTSMGMQAGGLEGCGTTTFTVP